MYVTCTALWTEPRRSWCLSPGMWANMRRQSGTCIQYEDAQGQRDGWRGVGGKMGCFPGAGGTWWGCSEGCNVFTHWGLYLSAIVPIKLCNKPAQNSVANNKCLFLILASTCLLSFITSGLSLALLGFKRRVDSRSALESLIFPGWWHPEADSSHREGRSTRGQDQLCRHLQASAHTPSTNANHITESNLRETRDSTSRGENYKVTWQRARTQEGGWRSRTVMSNSGTSRRCQNPHPGPTSQETESWPRAWGQVIYFLPDEVSPSVKQE